MKHIHTFESFLNESNEVTPQVIADFIKNNEKHFAAFLKPKNISATVKGDTCIIKPGSNSFTITIDFEKKMVDSTGKPNTGESTSYVEIMEYVKNKTKFTVNNTGNK
jgi:hypothetical protein